MLLLLLACRTDKDPIETALVETEAPVEETQDPGRLDGDGDGVAAGEDCDDADPSRYPGAEELCDGVDQDCDEQVDEGVTATWYVDGDGDGYGAGDVQQGCEPPEASAEVAGDCDDEDAGLFPEEGTCPVGRSCLEVLTEDGAATDGVYVLDPSGSGVGHGPTSVYCDMSGGGWMLLGRQTPDAQLTRTVDDIALDASFDGGWDPSATHRWGNDRLAELAPTQAFRITSHELDGTPRDEAFFSPACAIDWDAYVGTFRGERTEHYDACGLAYSDAELTTALGNHSDNNCSLGIGQNNNGQYCSIRMGSCNCYTEACSSTWAEQEGVAAPCAFQEWQQVVMALWVR